MKTPPEYRTRLPQRTIRIVVTGGLGDAFLATPTLAALKRKYPASRIRIYCASVHRDVFLGNPHVASVTTIRWWCKLLRFVPHFTTSYGHLFPATTSSRRAAELIAERFGLNLTKEERKLQVFLRPDEEQRGRQIAARYRNPVVIHITSRFSRNQMWPLENWHALVRAVPEVTFLQVGVKAEKCVDGAVNLRGDLSFRDSLAVLKHAAAFVGVVSVFAHATNAVGTPGIVFYGPSSASVWGHDNLLCLDKKLRCAPCVDLLHGPCPYDQECMHRISVEEVKAELLRMVARPPVELAAPTEIAV